MQPINEPQATADWRDFFSAIIAGGDDYVQAAVAAAFGALADGEDCTSSVLAGMRAARDSTSTLSGPATRVACSSLPWLPGPPPLPHDSVRADDSCRARRRLSPLAITSCRDES